MKTVETYQHNPIERKMLEVVWRFMPSFQNANMLRSESKPVLFQYMGKSSLSVRGMITGKYYHFTIPGAVQEVDYRDANDMCSVPNLRTLANE